jgi:hypothetical protein
LSWIIIGCWAVELDSPLSDVTGTKEELSPSDTICTPCEAKRIPFSCID